VNANRTTSVDDQPPASQPTAKNTVKHNAHVSTGWGAKMQGQTKKYYPTKEVWRFFEAGAANPCQLWQPYL